MPDSYLAADEPQSGLWRENYITTFLERDITQLGINIPARTLRRFWSMLAHYHGQVLNFSELGRSFGISDLTVRKYVDILTRTLDQLEHFAGKLFVGLLHFNQIAFSLEFFLFSAINDRNS